MGSSVRLVFLFLLVAVTPGVSLGNQRRGPSALTHFSADEQAMITSACGLDRQTSRPAEYYYDCIRDQQAALRTSPGIPDLSHIATTEREMIISACELDRQTNGPTRYYQCLRNRLAALGFGASVTTSGHAFGPEAQPRSGEIGNSPSSSTVAGQKSQGFHPAILLLVTLFGSPFIVYLYKRSRHRSCFGCDSYTPNSNQICDACRERFEAAKIRHREEQQREVEPSTAQHRLQEEESRERPCSLKDLQGLTGPEFERLIASLFSRDGYKVSFRGHSGIGGIDMVLEMGGSKDVIRCIRCKANIGPPVVREFHKSMVLEEAKHGFVVATTSFTHSAKEFADEKPITLIDGHYIIAWSSWAASAREYAGAAQSGRDFDPYEVLGLSAGASKDEIRSAYRGLVAKYHPDKVAHLGLEFEAIAREKALAINRAFEMLNHS
jgi:hypothetical protein